jgi:membrane protein implicated in regulation of membrane protease activity
LTLVSGIAAAFAAVGFFIVAVILLEGAWWFPAASGACFTIVAVAQLRALRRKLAEPVGRRFPSGRGEAERE